MKRWCLALALAVLAGSVTVAQTPAAAVRAESGSAQPSLDDLLWVARPLVVFADNPNDPRLRQQLRMLEERPEDLTDRDVVVLTDSTPEDSGPLRRQLRPRGFGIVLIEAHSNRMVHLRPLVFEIVRALGGIGPGELRCVAA